MRNALYDAGMVALEAAGLGHMRRRLVAGVAGEVLEIGVGTGRQLRHYAPGARVTGIDTDAAALDRARGRGAVAVVEAPAERLPFPDGAFDWVVSALCLCGVEDPGRAAGEIARVLRPGGRLRALEHVRSPRRRVAAAQGRIAPVWHRLVTCHVDRRTPAILREHGFTVRIARERAAGALVLLEAAPSCR